MKTKHMLYLAFLIGVGSFFIGCNDNSCPDGMHEQELQDGRTICVPDDN